MLISNKSAMGVLGQFLLGLPNDGFSVAFSIITSNN
jgi:hypothetical protein